MSSSRSHSQVTQFADCGYKYYLSRKRDSVQRPSWALIGGRAIHATIETFERKATYAETHKRPDAWPSAAQARTWFRNHMLNEIEKEKDSAPPEYMELSDWSAANKGKEDFAWWLREGTLMAQYYAEMNPANRGFSTVLLEPGKLALEVRLELDFGSVKDVLIADHMTLDKYGVVDIIDYKSGRMLPQDRGLQVITTAHAVQQLYPHLDVRGGSYFDLRKGKMSRVYQTDEIPLDAIVHMYETMDRAESAGLYLPRVSSFCTSCYVRRDCVYGGEATQLYTE